MLLRVFTLTLLPGWNSSVSLTHSHGIFPSLVYETTLLGHYKSNPQPNPTLTRSSRVPSYLYTSMYLHRRTHTHTHTRTNICADVSRIRVHNDRSRHTYRPTPTTRTRDALSHTPSAHEETRNRSCGPEGTRFTDPSCKRRYRYLHRPISARRLIGSVCEYLGP